MKCPVCKGKGIIRKPKKQMSGIRKDMALVLHKYGYTFREIADAVGWKSRQSAQQAIATAIEKDDE